MTAWRARFLMWLLMAGVLLVHGAATAPLPNTPAAMLLFHGSAALFDWLLLLIAPRLLSGRMLDHTQWLLWASIGGNAAGWWLYMGYAAPSYYNVFMWWLTIAQWCRLAIPDRHADTPGFDLVPHRDRLGGGYHS